MFGVAVAPTPRQPKTSKNNCMAEELKKDADLITATKKMSKLEALAELQEKTKEATALFEECERENHTLIVTLTRLEEASEILVEVEDLCATMQAGIIEFLDKKELEERNGGI